MLRPLLASLLLVGCTRTPPPQAPAPTPTSPLAPPDLDSDGILDPDDKCPDVKGVPPDGCPIKDSDSDGFLDPDDKCPDDPGIAPDGCPIPDTDFDGILDPDDTCPDLTEVRNGYTDSDGCPDEIPPDLAGLTGVVKGVQFEIDKDILKPSSFPALDQAVVLLQKHPEVRIEISNHTDNTTQPIYGSSLSPRRARAVERYLVEHGIDEKRLETRGAWGDEPIESNKTAKGRAKNRRIEFTILVQ